MLNISITYLILNRCGNFVAKKNAWLKNQAFLVG